MLLLALNVRARYKQCHHKLVLALKRGIHIILKRTDHDEFASLAQCPAGWMMFPLPYDTTNRLYFIIHSINMFRFMRPEEGASPFGRPMVKNSDPENQAFIAGIKGKRDLDKTCHLYYGFQHIGPHWRIRFYQRILYVITCEERMTCQNRGSFQIGCCILAILFTFGCASTPKCDSKEVPKWLSATPHDDTYFYAVGISGQTRKVNDAWIQAGNRGRAELGRIIFSHVSSQDTIVNTSRGQYSSQLIDILSDTELNYTEIIERWYDSCGDYGPPHYYYVLLRMNKKTASAVLRSLN